MGREERERERERERDTERERERERKWWVKGKRDRHGALEHVCVKQRREENI